MGNWTQGVVDGEAKRLGERRMWMPRIHELAYMTL